MSLTASFAPYAELQRAAGTPYLVTAFAARLPITLVPVSVLAAVTTGTGSVAVGGLAAAATSVGEAVGGPTLGALADRLARRGGQRPVLLVAAAVNVAALLVVAVGAASLPVPLLLLATLVAGFAMPPIGSFSRARWMRRTPALVPTAMAGESAADEVAYVLGPALAGLVAIAGSPSASLLVAGALVAVAVPAFALHPSATAPAAGTTPAATDDDAGASGALLRRLAVVIVAAVGMGLFFGGGQTTLTAAAQEAGSIGAGGLLVAAMGVGSAFTALAMVAVPDRVSLAARLAAAAGVLLVGIATMAVSLALTPSLVALAAATALAGLAVGPAMVTITSMAAERSTAGSGATAMTLVGSGIVVGVGSGAAAAGWLAEHHGALHATGVLAVAALVLLAAAVASWRRPARPLPEQAPRSSTPGAAREAAA